ncbi:hypothetical protein HPP92_008800 [Vanilla planifolia]|uniref:Sugar phosphate transporter domain-containing protein n=1 Tax=Vanilla planifolia TaxID=51239 RepID=A0A835REP4_VANPL|nr:hypothetical protein HPP92_008800 [Vanilla planifolia]
MAESNLVLERGKGEELACSSEGKVGGSFIKSGVRNPAICKERSFPHCFGTDGISVSTKPVEGSDESGTPRGSDSLDLPLLHDAGKVGALSMVERQFSNGLTPGRTNTDSLETNADVKDSGRNLISAVIVVKTLFYILVWYIFSTCLTLYNKTLLGDHLGKFPAPFLMNTVHFSLQAILAKTISCFCVPAF